ncbi:hypothetical protein MPPM_0192 [Methylorubrum populi]|uniref:Uncharacterized protein n=1 Tax=Methylorubrum populi TaxID=223967 RepID=A0A161JL22_9HYPH|nr:hypothetical protein MPPM_0192 [Methylorubrum populi]
MGGPKRGALATKACYLRLQLALAPLESLDLGLAHDRAPIQVETGDEREGAGMADVIKPGNRRGAEGRISPAQLGGAGSAAAEA